MRVRANAMAQYTLQGSGVIGLNIGLSRLIFDVQAYPHSYSFGKAVPNNYYDVGLVRVGVQGVYYPARPIDAQSMLLDVPPDANTLGYNIFTPGTVRVTEQFAQPPANEDLQPWDRNPTVVTRSYFGGVNGGTGTTTSWNYAVPAGRKFLLAKAQVSIDRYVNPTTPSYSFCQIQGDAGTYSFAYYAQAEAGAQVYDDLRAGPTVLKAGQTVQGLYSNGDTGGSLFMVLIMVGTEFDA